MKVSVYINGIEKDLKIVREAIEITTSHKVPATKLKEIKTHGGVTIFDLSLEEATTLVAIIKEHFKAVDIIIICDDPQESTEVASTLEDPYHKHYTHSYDPWDTYGAYD